MSNLTLLFSVLFSLFAFSSLQCDISTFKDTLVVLKQNYKYYRLLIDDCISPETMGLYNKKSSPIELAISNQTINHINKRAIADLNDLFVITITYNNIETIEEEAFFNLPQVQEISLHSNNISWLQMEIFVNLTKLKYVKLQNNSLEVLPQSVFYDLPNLETVDLKRNKIRAFKQEWFRMTPNLTTVNMAENLIDSISRGSFITLTNLRVLNFYHNQIEYVHFNAFDGLNKLWFLNLGFNKIAKFDFNFPALPELKWFALYYNKITYISTEALSLAEKSIIMLSLTFNPLQCSCLERAMKWAADHNITLLWSCDDENPACVIPKNRPEKCMERNGEDLYSSYFVNSVRECVKNLLTF